ncbi:MAG: DUF4261 domain-containing protein [Deltaproteobacteria bacterium]|nr:DUF4261 domain-containing protein [Deltaproteobacteria bacterium]
MVQVLTPRPVDMTDIDMPIATGDVPVRVRTYQAEPEIFAAELDRALQWSWLWQDRWAELQKRCPWSIVVEMTAERPVHYAGMLLTFVGILDRVLSLLDEADRDASLLHWIPAQQILSMMQYRVLREDLGLCGPAINVRIANATGRPGELLADTVGLAELGLPDLQVFFSDRDPGEVAKKLRRLARSMFVGERLDVDWHEEPSIVPPERDTLTLDLD